VQAFTIAAFGWLRPHPMRFAQIHSALDGYQLSPGATAHQAGEKLSLISKKIILMSK
jgi:hypothetical protein